MLSRVGMRASTALGISGNSQQACGHISKRAPLTNNRGLCPEYPHHQGDRDINKGGDGAATTGMVAICVSRVNQAGDRLSVNTNMAPDPQLRQLVSIAITHQFNSTEQTCSPLARRNMMVPPRRSS